MITFLKRRPMDIHVKIGLFFLLFVQVKLDLK